MPGEAGSGVGKRVPGREARLRPEAHWKEARRPAGGVTGDRAAELGRVLSGRALRAQEGLFPKNNRKSSFEYRVIADELFFLFKQPPIFKKYLLIYLFFHLFGCARS